MNDDILERRKKRLERLAAKRAAEQQSAAKAEDTSTDTTTHSQDHENTSTPAENVEKVTKVEAEEDNHTNNEILELEKLMQSVVDSNKNNMADVVEIEDEHKKDNPIILSSALNDSVEDDKKLEKQDTSQIQGSGGSLANPLSPIEETAISQPKSNPDRSSLTTTLNKNREEEEKEDNHGSGRGAMATTVTNDVDSNRRRSSRSSELKEKLEALSVETEKKRRSSSRRTSNQQLSDILASVNAAREAGIITSKSGSRTSLSTTTGMSKEEKRRSRMEDIELKLQEARQRRESLTLAKKRASASPSSLDDIEAIKSRAKILLESSNTSSSSNNNNNVIKKDRNSIRIDDTLSPEEKFKITQDMEEKGINSPELLAIKNRISRIVKSDELDRLSPNSEKKRSSYLGKDDPKIKALLSKRSSLDASLIKDMPAIISSSPDCDQSMLRRSFQVADEENLAEKSIEYPESTDVLSMEDNLKDSIKSSSSRPQTPKEVLSPLERKEKEEEEEEREQEKEQELNKKNDRQDYEQQQYQQQGEEEKENYRQQQYENEYEQPQQYKNEYEQQPSDTPDNNYNNQEIINKDQDLSIQIENQEDYDGNYKRLNNSNNNNNNLTVNENQRYRKTSPRSSPVTPVKPIDAFMRNDMGPQNEDEFWESMIGEFKDYFMDIPSYVLQKIRNGIPHKLRGKIWKVMSGADNDHLDNLYDQLLMEESPFEKQIIRDVTRTFPHMSMFSEKNGKGQTMLFNLMKAYSLYDTEVGYCQGLCFIVGPLLMQRLNEKEAFSIFVRMMDEPESRPENELEESTEDTRQTRRYAFRSLFTPRMPGVNLMMYQFDYFLKTYLPALYGHLLRHNIVSTMYASQWFLTIFAYNFPLPLVFRIFDILLAEGPGVTILRFSIAILRRNQSRILEMESFEEILEFLKGNKIFEIYGEGKEAHNDVVNDAMSICNIICETELRRLRQEFEKTDDASQIANHGGEMELLSARMTLRELRQQRNYDHNLIEELKTQIEVLSEEVNEARRDVDPLRDENETLRVQCHELKEMLTNEDRKLQSIWEDAVRKMEQENLQLKSQLSSAEGQLIDAKMLMANMEEEKDVLISSIEALKNAFGANEVQQIITAVVRGNSSSSLNQSQTSIRRSDSITSNRSQGGSSIISNSNATGWFNNMSSAISSYMEKSSTRHSQSNLSSTGSVENMEITEEPNNVATTTTSSQTSSRWKFGWKK